MGGEEVNASLIKPEDPLDHPPGFVSSGSPVLDDFWLRHGARFTELLHVGGHAPCSYGYIHSGGLYGRRGLDHQEFYESVRYLAYIDGMLNVLGPDAAKWFGDKVEEETNKKKSEAQKAKDEMAKEDFHSADNDEGDK